MYSLFIIVACFATSVYTIENDILFESCSSEIRKSQVDVNKCLSVAINFRIKPLLDETAQSIKNNESTSEAFVSKYCPIFNKVYKCANLFTGGSKECKNEPRIVRMGSEANITTTLIISILDLVCAGGDMGATVVDQFIADDVLMFVDKQSESLTDCMFLFEDRPLWYRNDKQKKLFLQALTLTTSCLSDYFDGEKKYFLKNLIVRLGRQFIENIARSSF